MPNQPFNERISSHPNEIPPNTYIATEISFILRQRTIMFRFIYECLSHTEKVSDSILIIDLYEVYRMWYSNRNDSRSRPKPFLFFRMELMKNISPPHMENEVPGIAIYGYKFQEWCKWGCDDWILDGFRNLLN